MQGIGKTDIGQVRQRNEDAFSLHLPIWAAVADGMGGHLGGEQASNLAIQSLEDELLPQNQPSDGQIDSWIASAIEDANSLVYKHSLDNPELAGMGTTLSLIYFSNSRMYWGHIGDCRIYLYRDNTLRLLTKDHALVGKEGHSSNILTRALGVGQYIKVDTGSLAVFPGDHLLVCSDGLHGFVENNDLKNTFDNLKGKPNAILDSLFEKVNQQGSRDNLTAVCWLVE